MKKEKSIHYKFETLSDIHRMLGFPKPLHPLVSLTESFGKDLDLTGLPESFTQSFYKISYKENVRGKIKYGQGYYDFDEGGMVFIAPDQIGSRGDTRGDHSGYTLFIHPDFLMSYPLAKKIRQYGFFSYATNEALHLSEKEKATIFAIFKAIDDELQDRLDDISHDVVVMQIELLLKHCERCYKRQFITRKSLNNDLLQKLEDTLEDYFNSGKSSLHGIPTVKYLSLQMNMSPNYLSDMLRSLTGHSAQQHIHQKLIEKAKEKLSVTNFSISDVAYAVGFEHSQSFSKFFKAKTKISPMEFRQSFN